MSMNDPLGDMLTRIRNAQLRGKSTVRTPASKLRAWVLDVLQTEGYIRGYEHGTSKAGHPELEIRVEICRWHPCHPRIATYFDPRSPRLFRRSRNPADPQRSWDFGSFHAEGRDVRCSSPRRQCWWRSALPCVLRRAEMSRIGKKPVELPSGVSAQVSGQTIEVKGPKGTRSFTANDDVDIVLDGNTVSVKPRGLSKRARQQWGMTRSMVANLATGVSTGFKKELELVGVGYRAAMQGKDLKLSLGYSHEVCSRFPTASRVSAPKQTEVVVEGMDQQQVGEVAANIRKWRAPEPYKGKGIRYKDEYIFRKEGKKK